MPRFDGTGPMGQGPRTGRGMGNCPGGMGYNSGYGQERCRRFFSKKEEAEILEQDLKAIKERLEEVKG